MRSWCSMASMSSVSSGVRLPSVFCWRTSSMSIKCLATGKVLLRLSAGRMRHEPQEHRGLVEERTGQVGQARRGQLDSGDCLGPLARGSAPGLCGRPLALALDLALPIFVDNDLLFGILCHDGTCCTANRCRTAAADEPGKQRMRPGGLRLELGMILHGDEPGMRGNFHDLDQRAVGTQAHRAHAPGLRTARDRHC